MIRLPVFFAVLFSLACASAFGQVNAWPRIHADQNNSGQAIADGSNGFGLWSYQASAPIDSSAAVDSNWNVYFGTTDGYLVSLDAHGNVRWKFQAGGQVYSPAIGPDGNIYVGSADDNLYAISASSGSVMWQFQAKGPVRTTPVFDEYGEVVFGSDDHNIYSVANGTLIVKATATSTVSLTPACPPGGTACYFVVDDGTLVVFQSHVGGIQPVASNSGGYSTSPTMDPAGNLYVGSSDSNIYVYSTTTFGNPLLWSYKAASAITTTPAIGPDGTIYFGTQGGVLYAYNHAFPNNPLVNWVCVQPTGPINSSPALGDNGVVYFGSDDGHVYGAGFPGNVVWDVNIVGSKVRSSPAITFDGTIMVGAENSTFYAIGTQSPIPVSSVTVSPSSVIGGTGMVGTINLAQSAPAGGDIVNLRLQNEPQGTPPVIPPPCSSVPPVIQVPQFQTSVQFAITTTLPSDVTTVDLFAASGFTIAQTSFVVADEPLVFWQLTPSSVVGGNGVIGTAQISAPAGPGGEIVHFTESIPGVKPWTDAIAPGSQVLQEAIGSIGVDSTSSVTATASAGGVTLSAVLTVKPANLVSITLLPTQVVGGVANSIGTINLDGDPGPSGCLVNLSSSDTNVATVPSTSLVYIDRAGLHNTFTVTSLAVTSNTNVTITGMFNQVSESANLLVTPPQLLSLVINPSSVLGGLSCVGTVNLTSVTPSGGITVQLQAQGTDVQVPSSVTIPQGSSNTTFNVNTNGVATTETQSISASWDGVTLTANVKLTPPTVQSVSIGPTVTVGGSNVVLKGLVTLTGASSPVVANGDVVKLTSSDTTVATVPSSITISGGASTGAFSVATLPVLSTRLVTITATFNNTSQTATITVNPVQIAGIALNPSIVGGGSPSQGQVSVTSTAGPAGYVVNLSTDKPEASAPQTVLIPAGASVASFIVNTKAVTKQEDVRVTGAYSSSSNTAILTLIPTVLGTLTISPTSLIGGNNAIGTILLDGAALAPGLKVSLSSSSGDASVPGSVTVPTGATSTTFVIKTKGVSVTTVATITAKLAKNTATAKLTILPAPLQSLSLSTGSVIGDSSTVVTGTVTLAGFGTNTVVSLSSSDPSAASVPLSVKVPSGKASATFTVTHNLVSSSQTVTITASAGGITKTATLTVNPMQVVSLSLTPTSVVGGKTSAGVVTLNAAVGSKPVSVKLASSSSDAIVPATVSVGGRQSTGKFTVKTVKVTSTATATITATLGSSSAGKALTITSK